jgi:hypothetical protein
MSSQRKKAARVSPISKRLEDIRRAEGLSVRGFFDTIGADAFASYAAAVTYHAGREPPVQYLAATSKRFGYRLEWLATGEGESSEHHEKLRHTLDAALDERLLRVFPEYRAFSPASRHQMYTAITAYADLLGLYCDAEAANDSEFDDFDADEEYEDLSDLDPLVWAQTSTMVGAERIIYRGIRRYIMEPLRAWGGLSWKDPAQRDTICQILESRAGENYVTAALHALKLSVDLRPGQPMVKP